MFSALNENKIEKSTRNGVYCDLWIYGCNSI
jgi:hypothetical protein